MRAEAVGHIIDQCPSLQWRAVIAVSPFAGLRYPSQIVETRWGDIDWERCRRAAANAGCPACVVPMRPELRHILQALFDRTPEGREAVVPRPAYPTTNRRTTCTKRIAREACEPWPRRFPSMRASGATDGAEALPAREVASWLGHGPRVAANHSLQTRAAHSEAAIQAGARTEPIPAGSKSGHA